MSEANDTAISEVVVMSWRTYLLIGLVAATCFVYAFGTVRIHSQAIAEVVPIDKIPRNSYKTWSLFLICTPDWVSSERSRELERLYWGFRGFGDAIGKNNLAVWFWSERTLLPNPRLAEKVDVARSAEYCRELRLRPSEGPFIVVTSEYPQLGAFPQERAVFELGALDPTTLTKLLNALTDDLLLEGKVEAARHALDKSSVPPAAASQPSEDRLYIRILESMRQTVITLGCLPTKLVITTGFFSAEVRGCVK